MSKWKNVYGIPGWWTEEDGPGTVKLQGIPGYHDGTKVRDLKTGNVIIWIFGYKSLVLNSFPSKTGKTYSITTKSLETDKVCIRRMSADRLVVLLNKKTERGTK